MNPADLQAVDRLAIDRTRLAYDRTTLAWVRTAASLISFGFAVYQFVQHRAEGRDVQVEGLISPRGLAVILIGLGLAALLLATIEHRRNMAMLRAEYGPMPFSLPALVALLMAALGVVGLWSVLLRI